MAVTLGIYGDDTAAGFTTITPSPDSNCIYVSSSGDDTNPGTVTLPLKTLAKACDYTVARTDVGSIYNTIVIAGISNGAGGAGTILNVTAIANTGWIGVGQIVTESGMTT